MTGTTLFPTWSSLSPFGLAQKFVDLFLAQRIFLRLGEHARWHARNLQLLEEACPGEPLQECCDECAHLRLHANMIPRYA